MNDLQILNTITRAFMQGFTACSVEYPNDVLDTRQLDEWVRLSVKSYTPQTLNLAKTSAMRRGCIYVQVFTKTKIGAGRATELGVLAANVFESKIISNIEFDFASVTQIGNGLIDSSTSQDSGWYQVQVIIDYKVVV